jgi:phosphoacetylglucosamine mutase
MPPIVEKIIEKSVIYPKPMGFLPIYGTAGFRAHASLLHSTLFRCGILIAARSLSVKKNVGAMITASHNPEEYNGIKLIDFTGDMLDTEWEQVATKLCQAETDEDIEECIKTVMPCKNGCNRNFKVFIGRDTRSTCKDLLCPLIDGIAAMEVKHVNLGMVTTPQLHFFVSNSNKYNHIESQVLFPELYYTTLLNAFETLFEPDGYVRTPLYVDCANGVGGLIMSEVVAKMERCESKLDLKIVLRNIGEGRLNDGCGADYVQTHRDFPEHFENVPEGARCCSLDGDADRIVYFTRRRGQFMLLDGDRLSILYASYLKYLLLYIPCSISMGIIQTPYANGKSTSFIEKAMNLPVSISCTGIKHLSKEARKYDIGVYFEPCGHGSIYFDKNLINKLEEYEDDNEHVLKLLAIYSLMNQNIGDGIACILLAEAILSAGCPLEDWVSFYTDYPNIQRNIDVVKKEILKTMDYERKCVAPIGLQADIDAAVSLYPYGRAFVRPSGTERKVRIYVETVDEMDTIRLANDVETAVRNKFMGC